MMRFNGERWEMFGPILEDAGTCGLVWRFRSPHHCCREFVMRTSEPKPH